VIPSATVTAAAARISREPSQRTFSGRASVGRIAMTDHRSVEELLDFRRQVAELYARIRACDDPRTAHGLWCDTRRRLYATHPQSPLPAGERESFGGPHVWDYDPAWRLLATVEAASEQAFELPASDGGTMSFVRFARARTERLSLDLFWLTSYGGGLFVPFADATSGGESYGGGRYALDTVKGADLGTRDGLLVLDLNFAYQPSCSYDGRWTCPLSPPANRVDVAVRAGERSSP
jgi:uncharacterized protein